MFSYYLNRQHPNIKFTYELEEDTSLPFLDILVTHVENSSVTNLYWRKPSLVYTLILIVFHRFSIKLISFLFLSIVLSKFVRHMAFHSQICNIKRFLQQNRFPSQLIDRIIKRFLNKQYVADIKPSNVPQLPIFLFLPYLGVYSIHLKKGLTKFLGKSYPHVDLKLVFELISLLVAFSL